LREIEDTSEDGAGQPGLFDTDADADADGEADDERAPGA
jgi:hypothetical protein